jgi:hypothetical protein
MQALRGGLTRQPNQPKNTDYMNTPDTLNAVELNTTREEREFLLETSFIMEDMEMEENDLFASYHNRANELED